jgi:serine/threonine protein kinase
VAAHEFHEGSSSGSDDPVADRAELDHDIMKRTDTLRNGEFLSEYVLEEMLGQGSFGIVFACKRKRGESIDSLAVKLVDKVETPPEDIVQETKIHPQLAHPNILKVHEVIDERFFVCIVMDRFTGGDLVKCLQSYSNAKTRIRSGKIVHVARQMIDGIAYLHGRDIVHRDVKADNYLLDRENIMDSECRVILADFGFAASCAHGERLRRRCGTRMYWSPELWDRNYALKVDLWAIAVTLYGIMEGVFPFRSEWEVRHKEVIWHRITAPRCVDFMGRLLRKSEKDRDTAVEALQHRWIASSSEAGGRSPSPRLSALDAPEEVCGVGD